MISRDVIFNEDNFCTKSTETEKKDPIETDIQVDPAEVEDENTQPEYTRPEKRHRYPDRQRQVPVRYGIDEFVDAAITKRKVVDLESIEEDSKVKNGVRAANAEYKSLMENNTWELVNLLDCQKLIDCKWIFKVKRFNSAMNI